jgi:hypothetical protein
VGTEQAIGGGVPLLFRPSDHLLTAARYLGLTGLLVGVVGLAGRWLAWPLLTSTVGPTAYLFAAHPRTEPAGLRNAAIGHAVALGLGLGALALFGLEHDPSVSSAGIPSWRQVIASAAAVGLTMSVLELLGSHHAPAAATALLVTTGLAKPGAPLIGLVVGLAIVVTLGPLCARWPLPSRDGPSTMSRSVGATSGLPRTTGGPQR